MDLLIDVQLSKPNKNPYAILRAANGQVLTAIGRGIFQVKMISVVAYIFRDEDLVHNLLGIAPFADCGCKAVFTAHDFNLYHKKILLLTGKRHSANLWHISLDPLNKTPLEQHSYVVTNHEHDIEQITTDAEPMFKQSHAGPDKYKGAPANLPEANHTKESRLNKLRLCAQLLTKTALLLHEDTRRDEKYVQFVHACLGSPPPRTYFESFRERLLVGDKPIPTSHVTPSSKAHAQLGSHSKRSFNKDPNITTSRIVRLC